MTGTPHAHRALALRLVAVLAASAVSCGPGRTPDEGLPTVPVAVSTPSAAVPTPSAAPADLATLAITSFSFRADPQPAGMAYRPDVIIEETSGKGTARLQSIWIEVPGKRVELLESCEVRGPVVIGPRQRFELFAGSQYFCMLFTGSASHGVTASLTASYLDSVGHGGTAVASATLP